MRSEVSMVRASKPFYSMWKKTPSGRNSARSRQHHSIRLAQPKRYLLAVILDAVLLVTTPAAFGLALNGLCTRETEQ
jgi:hypothetical protein